MLGVFGRFGACSARRSLRTVSAVRSPHYRYGTTPAPDTHQEPTEAERQEWEKQLIANGALPSDFLEATGSSHIGPEQFRMHPRGNRDANAVAKLGFPFVAQELHIPIEKLAKFWNKGFENIGDHWQAEYVVGCYALNKKINELGVFQELTLIDLMKANAGEVTEYACIVFNHHHFFSGLLPLERPYPRDIAFARLLDDSFGSFSRFKNLFKDNAMRLFGSGWIFLAASPDGNLHIITTENNGNPHQIGMIPLLTLDLFEHAYYGDHRNDRGAYIDSFWEVVDWKQVVAQYREAFPFKLSEERPTETGDSIWIPSDFQFPPK